MSMFSDSYNYCQEPKFHQQVWDPFPEFQFRSSLIAQRPAPAFSSETSSFGLTKLEWKETPEAHVLKADLPGVKKNEVKLEVEGRILCIGGEKKVEKEVKNDMWHRVEHSTGSFVRRFKLPDNAKVDELSAYLENGVLTVTIPKELPKYNPKRTIQIRGN